MLSVITPTPNDYIVSLILSPGEATHLVDILERTKRTLGRSFCKTKDWKTANEHNLVEDLIELFTKPGTGLHRSTSKPYKLSTDKL